MLYTIPIAVEFECPLRVGDILIRDPLEKGFAKGLYRVQTFSFDVHHTMILDYDPSEARVAASIAELMPREVIIGMYGLWDSYWNWNEDNEDIKTALTSGDAKTRKRAVSWARKKESYLKAGFVGVPQCPGIPWSIRLSDFLRDETGENNNKAYRWLQSNSQENKEDPGPDSRQRNKQAREDFWAYLEYEAEASVLTRSRDEIVAQFNKL